MKYIKIVKDDEPLAIMKYSNDGRIGSYDCSLGVAILNSDEEEYKTLENKFIESDPNRRQKSE